MKAKPFSVCAAVVAAGLAVIFSWKLASHAARHSTSATADAAIAKRIDAAKASATRALPALPLARPGSVPSAAETWPSPRLSAEEIVARLLKEIHLALASSDQAVRDHALDDLLPALVLKDVSAAAALAELSTGAEMRDEVLRRVARLWAAQDAAGALAWAAALPDAEEQDAAVSVVCLQVAEANPAEAVRLRENYTSDNRSDPVLVELAQRWAEKELSTALAWAAARPDGGQRDQIVARLAYVQSQTAPLAAALLAVERIPPGETQTEAVISVLHQWARVDRAAATAWVERFPAGEVRERAVRELAAIADTRS